MLNIKKSLSITNLALNYCQGFFIIVILLFMIGCSSLKMNRLSLPRFHNDMPRLGVTYKEVQVIYGRPDYGASYRSARGLFTLWEYRIGYESVYFYFQDGILIATQG